MKKLVTFFALAMLIAGLSGIPAFAGIVDPTLMKGRCFQCEGTTIIGQEGIPAQGNIDRGCEGLQSASGMFDYEDFGKNSVGQLCTEGYRSYCESGEKGTGHRAIFEMCACIDAGVWDELKAGDTFDISLEILVEKDGTLYNGDNGVYWAQNVASIGVNLATEKDTHCEDTDCLPRDFRFRGGFSTLMANGNVGTPGIDPVVKIVPDYTGGLVMPNDPALIGSDVLYAWFDVPAMIVDPDTVERGDRVWVKVCFTRNYSSTIGYCEECCCLISIGEICCPEGSTPGVISSLIFPYFTEINSPNWWFGMTIANLTDTDGTATITMYEKDGDMATGTVTVPARSMKILSDADMELTLTISTAGTLGDTQSYVLVSGDFTMTGFAMMGKPSTGESMGYLPK